MIVQLAIAAQEIEAQVRLTTEQGLTHLEEAIVGALLCGHDTAEELGEFLGIGARMAVDVLHGLWARGHVTVDFSDGRVEVTSEARAAQLDPDRRLESGTVQVEPRSFLHEPISGAVLSRTASRRVPDDAVVLPRDLVTSPDDVPRDQLVQLLQRELNELEEGPRLASRVLDVSLGPRSTRRAGKDRRVVVEAAVHLDDAGRVRLRFLRSPFGDRASRLLEGYLEARCDANPAEPFASTLRGRADRHLDAPDTARQQLDTVRTRLALAEEAPDDDYLERVGDLIAADRAAAVAIERAGRDAASFTHVLGSDTLEAAAVELIGQAVHQVVLAAPRLVHRSMNRLFAAIDGALGRGVRVVVCWGDRPGLRLDEPLAALRAQLMRAHGDRLVWSTRSGRLAIRAIVCDGREMLVGSSPAEVLGATGATPVSVRVAGAPGRRETPQVIVDLLTFARNAFPDVDLASAITVDFDGEVESVDARAPVVAKLYEATLGGSPSQRADHLGVWAEHLDGREGALEGYEHEPSATLHRGGASRSALLDLLQRSESATVIRSRWVDVRAVDRDLLDALDLASEAGSIHLCSPGLDDDDPRLASLENWVAVDAEVDASLLVTDRHVLLTPFDLLSAIPGRSTDAVGLVAEDPKLARVLLQQMEGIYVPRQELEPEGPDTRGELVGPLLDLAAARTDLERIEIIDRAFEHADDPLALVDRWEATQQVSVVRRAAVVGLRRISDPAAASRRVDWLVADALARERYVEAAALSEALAPRGSLRTAALIACCPFEGAWLGQAAVDVALELEGSARFEASAAVSGLATELLFGPRPSTEVSEALSFLGERSGGSWAKVAEAVVDYIAACQEPLPLAYLGEHVSRTEAEAREADEWDGLHREIEDMRNRRRWSFATGLAVQAYLFGPDGPLTSIAEAAVDGIAKKQALGDHLPDDMRAAIDRAVHQQGVEPMAWRSQLAYLKSVERIVKTARRLSQSDLTGSASKPSDAVLEALSVLTCAVRADAGLLTVEEETEPDDLAVARRRFIQSLAPVLAWAPEGPR